jgi:phosphatidylserine synthase
MVSTIRYRSFKTIDLQARRPYKILLAVIILFFAITAKAHWTLLALAYGYLLSAFVGMARARLRRRGTPAAPPPGIGDATPIDSGTAQG